MISVLYQYFANISLYALGYWYTHGCLLRCAKLLHKEMYLNLWGGQGQNVMALM